MANNDWGVLMDEDFKEWLDGLNKDVRVTIVAGLEHLRRGGPKLGRPWVDTIGPLSRHPNMKELRIRMGTNEWRVLFAFDPNRNAILLHGGNKTPTKNWYKKNVPLADKRYERHIERMSSLVALK